MVGGELCIDVTTFSLYLWRKAIQAPANPAVGSFLPQPCIAGAGAADPGLRHQPSRPRDTSLQCSPPASTKQSLLLPTVLLT